jgi:hypothetical protein
MRLALVPRMHSDATEHAPVLCRALHDPEKKSTRMKAFNRNAARGAIGSTWRSPCTCVVASQASRCCGTSRARWGPEKFPAPFPVPRF